MHVYDTIVIGGGPAGCTAAMYAARSGLDTLLMEKMTPGGQMALTGDVENYPGFEEGIDGFALGMKMQKGAERNGVKTEYVSVSAFDLSEKVKKVFTDGGEYFARTVILATGTDPRELGIEKEKELVGKGVHYCAHCDGRFYKGKTVAVIGGGNSAAADALYLSRLAEKVYLVHRRDTLRAAGAEREALKKAENIEFVWKCVASALRGEESVHGVTLKNVTTQEEKDLPCDGVFISIGRKPNTDFLQIKAVLDEKGYIKADESTKTSLPGVFAAGDVRTKALRQIVTATADGAVAAAMAEKFLSQGTT